MNPDKRIERHVREFTLPGTRKADEHILNDALDAFEQAGSTRTGQTNPHIHNWITKTVAAMVAISVLIPLGYGASRMIRTLILKPAETSEISIEFKLDRDLAGDRLGRYIYNALQVGTKQNPDMIHARSIRFFVEDGQLRGTLRADVCSWPAFKWRTRITLRDRTDRRLASAVHVSENSGVKHNDWASGSRHTIHFVLGPWTSALQAQAESVSIEWTQVPKNTKTTPQAWVESSRLSVVYGRVTRPDGQPIANAVVQIREQPKEGQNGIAAPDVVTDGQGFYCFDDIHWAYHVGALVYNHEASGNGYYHQYKRLNRTLQGTNKVNFLFEDLSKGTASLKGQMLDPDGRPVTAFKFDMRNPVDWKDRSSEHLYQLGFVKLFSSPDGRFEVSGLPSGHYRVSLTPTLEEDGRRFDDIVRSREYLCELTPGEIVDMTHATEAKKAWYGRVLFTDGTPAVLPETKTEILQWSKGFDQGHVVATVDEDGYFTTRFSDSTLQRLKSGNAWLTINVTRSSRHFSNLQKETYPFRFMSMDKDKAQTLTVDRPVSYQGQILYMNGRPAVPPALPWDGARVNIRLRCTPATSSDGGITESLGALDKQGVFSILLTEAQRKKIETGEFSLEIMHPSYEDERSSSPIGRFPAELLRSGQDAITEHTLSSEGMTGTHRHLMQCLDSYDTLETLRSILKEWQAKHDGELPGTMALLNSETSTEGFARILETIEYQVRVTAGPDTEAYIMAYDKRLLERIKGTHVLFSDGTIAFLPQRKLDAVDLPQ